MGLDLPRFLSGAVVVESIFAWPGMGRLFWDEAQRTDIPVLMAVLMFTSVLVVVFNLLADIAYAFLDPRIRYT
jgi:peptide/nickel transport system permease protein